MQLLKHDPLGLVEAFVGVTAPTRQQRSLDLVGLVAEDQLSGRPAEEVVRGRLGYRLNQRNESFPHSSGVLGGTDRLERATTRTVEVAEDGSIAAVVPSGHRLRELRGGGRVPVAQRHERSSRLHRVPTAGEREPDGPVIRQRGGWRSGERDRVGELEEASVPLRLFRLRVQVDVELNIRAFEMSMHAVMRNRRRFFSLTVDDGRPVGRVEAVGGHLHGACDRGAFGRGRHRRRRCTDCGPDQQSRYHGTDCSAASAGGVIGHGPPSLGVSRTGHA